MINIKLKQRIKFGVIMLVVAIAIAFSAFTVVKYDVEGEKSVPFEVDKIIIISSATVSDINYDDGSNAAVSGSNSSGNSNTETPSDVNTTNDGTTAEDAEQQNSGGGQVESTETQVTGTENQEADAETQATDTITTEAQSNVPNNGNQAEENQNQPQDNKELTEEQANNNATQESPEERFIWEKNVIQTNDICIVLDENKEFGEEQIIKNVRIENIKILDNVKTGKIQVYMPSSLEDSLYKYTNEFLVNSSLTYTGNVEDNKKALQVRSKGGCIYISFANMGLEAYKSNEDQEIAQGAYILEKMNLTDEDLKFKVAFDLIIEVQDKSYKTNITLDLPVDGVVGQKETHLELTDFSKIVFKRM